MMLRLLILGVILLFVALGVVAVVRMLLHGSRDKRDDR